MALPPPQGEDDLVAAWRDRDDVDALVELVGEAVDARRLRLAARLANLLPDRVEGDEAVARARAAARLVLHRGLQPEDVSWSAFEEAWREVRRRRMDRMKERQRRALDGREGRVGRIRSRNRRG